MRTSTLVIIALVVVAGHAPVSHAQIPIVQIYFDEDLIFTGAPCPGMPPGTVFQNLYVVAEDFNMYMSAIEYRIQYPTLLMFLSDEIDPSFLVTGTSPEGIVITFPTPQDAFGKLLVQKVFVIWMCDSCGPGNIDTPLRVRSHPASAKVRAVRWPDGEFVDGWGVLSLICGSLPIHETTWGEIKALYK